MKRTLTVAFSVALLLACSDNRELLAPTPPASHSAAADGPLGFIEEPRIGAYSPNVPNPRNGRLPRKRISTGCSRSPDG